ncbi:MAG: hypothetical protein FD125_1685 [bacterium]|nr:MAG: hypothetical protein FD125_1685 [bacterium]
MDADRALAAQFPGLAAEPFGQTHSLSPRGQAGLAAAYLDQPVVALGQDFIQTRSERVFHAPDSAPGTHKVAISIRPVTVRPA